MLEDRSPQNESHEPAPGTESPQGYETREPLSMAMKVAIVIVVLIAGFAVGYGWLQHNAVQQLASERGDLSASLNQAKSQVDALTAKVNALSAVQAQQEAARVQAEAIKTEAVKNDQVPPPTSGVAHHRRHHVVNRSAAVDDPRWQKIQQQLGDQQKELNDSQKQIAETQANLEQAKSELNGNLQSARTELGGNIARTHDELVALEKKGERNYYEFSFEKSSTFHHTGPISISLHKANSKHEYCDLKLLVDDREITRKHVNLYESVTLHPEGDPRPIELVINRIDKDSVKGYVSAPKYHSPQQAATAASPATTAAVTLPAPAAPEASLEHRQTTSQ
jgi:hypothetical protein